MKLRDKDPQEIKARALQQIAVKQAEDCGPCADGYERLARRYGATDDEIERARRQVRSATLWETPLSRRRSLGIAFRGAAAAALALPLLGRTALAHGLDTPWFRELTGTEYTRLRAEARSHQTFQAYRRELVGKLGYRPYPSQDGAVHMSVTIADSPHEGMWLWETYQLDDRRLAWVNYEMRDGRVSVSAIRIDFTAEPPAAAGVPLGDVSAQCNECFYSNVLIFCPGCVLACAAFVPGSPAFWLCLLVCCGTVIGASWFGCGC